MTADKFSQTFGQSPEDQHILMTQSYYRDAPFKWLCSPLCGPLFLLGDKQAITTTDQPATTKSQKTTVT